jgi:hypothetical protein
LSNSFSEQFVQLKTKGMRSTHTFSFLLISLLLLASCSKTETQTRSFEMGVTPWPADFTSTELDNAYSFINNHCDIVSHHFDEGIPFQEAFNQTGWSTELVQDVTTRKTKTKAGRKILLSVAPLAGDRKTKAGYHTKSTTIADSTKTRWQQMPFNDSRIITAYVNYVSWLIDQLQPNYVNYGVESNVTTWDAQQFGLYKIFVAQVYAQLKIKYPNIPMMNSFIVDETSNGYTYAQQLLAYTDIVGLSAYPYVTVSSSANGNTDPKNFPANYFEKWMELDNRKPFAFAETGYIAEPLSIPSYSLNKQGNDAWQAAYLEKVLQLSNDRKATFFIWFCAKDYDAGNNTLRRLGLYNDVFSLWQDTGLFDENARERPTYKSWLNWMQRTKVN